MLAPVLEQKANPTGNPVGNGQTLRFTPVHKRRLTYNKYATCTAESLQYFRRAEKFLKALYTPKKEFCGLC
jgi:hypothetical protein